LLLKFAYDGTKFHGFQRQLDEITVEGEIIKVLKKFGYDTDIKSASRTDRGVSALGNVIKINADEPERLIGILNSHLKHIYFYGYSEMDVNPRHAIMRWYRYHLPDFGYDMERMQNCANVFIGEHDFRHFTKEKEKTVLSIYSINVQKFCNVIAVDFKAQRYVWNLIRRIVAAIIKCAEGVKFDDDIFEKPNNFGLAPPEPLILMDVKYGFPFKTINSKRKVKERFFLDFSSKLVYFYLFSEMPEAKAEDMQNLKTLNTRFQ